MRDQSMIERMARELCLAEYPNQPAGWHDDAWPAWTRLAKRVLTVMREPSRAMMNAKAVDDDGGKSKVDGYLDYLSADNIWRAMVEAALAED